MSVFFFVFISPKSSATFLVWLPPAFSAAHFLPLYFLSSLTSATPPDHREKLRKLRFFLDVIFYREKFPIGNFYIGNFYIGKSYFLNISILYSLGHFL
jgi:hypothetical protein